MRVKYIALLISLLMAVGAFLIPPRDFPHLIFPEQGEVTVLINGEEIIPPFSKDVKEYRALTLNTLYPNEMKVNGEKKTFKIKQLDTPERVFFKVGKEWYVLWTRDSNFPNYTYVENGASEGWLFVAPYHFQNKHPSAAFIINKDGKLVFYRRNIKPNGGISNFQKIVLPSGKIRFTLMAERKKEEGLSSYLMGTLVILDEQFRKIDEVSLLPEDSENWPYYIENHDSFMLDDHHYILTSVQKRSLKNEPSTKVINSIIQEVENGKVKFLWQSIDHPELKEDCIRFCDFENEEEFQDYVHLNSVLIDPKDNNLIVSFAANSSIMKIDRQTGRILWKLGGRNDQFGLKKEQLFLGQHSLSWTMDGYLMLFDNHSASFSEYFSEEDFPVRGLYNRARILKFKLDEKNKKVIDFKEVPLLYHTEFTGSVYQLPSGHYLVSYGPNTDMSVQEMDQTGKNVFMSLKFSSQLLTYRAYKYPTLFNEKNKKDLAI